MMPSPGVYTVEAVRSLIHDDEQALHDVCSRWVEVAVASGADVVTAVGVLLHDAYDFAAMVARGVAEDEGILVDRLLDTYAVAAMEMEPS